MGLAAMFGTVASKVAIDAATVGIGGAVGAFIVLGGAKLFRWLKNRTA